ncbi:MAG: glycosyltransferase family 4 protein [Caldimicrobium sp.]
MKVLMLTWEYPPFIVGGLGMACYGLFKALSELGVRIKMLLPTEEEVFFEINNPYEADFPLAKRENGEPLSPAPLKFFNFLYKIPEESVYAELKPFLESVPPEIHKKVEFKEVPEEVIQRLTKILSQGNSLLYKVFLYTQKAVKISQKIAFDIIHAHDWLTYPAGLFLKKIFKKPLIAHLHATEFDRALGFGHPVIHEIEYLGLTYSDCVIAVSNYTKGIALEHYHLPSEKIQVVHNGFTAKEKIVKKIKKFKEPVILFLGRLTPQKGPTIFLEIAKKVLSTGIKARFVIAGAGEMERELMLEAGSMGIGTHIMFTGFLTREEVEKALSLADIVVMPSPSEPFGIVALEAMYFENALIISKQSGASEIIENAYKVDFWDVDKMVEIILDLIHHPEKMKSLQKKAKAEVQKFTWDGPAKKVLSLYQRLLKEGSCSS